MKWSYIIPLASVAFLLSACSGGAQEEQSLADARRGVDAGIVETVKQDEPAPTPPASVLKMVQYPAANGPTSGYLTPASSDGKKHPAIIWVSGGDQSLGDFWSPQPDDNDQSAKVFRDAGLVVFYPSMRGLNGNPGRMEGFYGELDDLVAATNWLKQQPGVDPNQIYLGGHSTGGTLVLLASEYANAWAGVFAFGPVSDIAGYDGAVAVPIAPDNAQGVKLRSPIHWLNCVKHPTFVIEGAGQGNVSELRMMQAATDNPNLFFVSAADCDHFSVLKPVSTIIAKAIAEGKVADLTRKDGLTYQCR